MYAAYSPCPLSHHLADPICLSPSAAATYKEYQRLRDILDGKIQPPQPKDKEKDKDKDKAREHNNLRKRKSPQQLQHGQHHPSLTPSTKRFKPIETPSSRRQHPGDSIAMNMFTPGRAAATPCLSRKLFDSPAIPTSIGPTPQRDGRVLGLFDSLPFKDADIDSPCKPNGAIRLSQVVEAGREVMTAAAAAAATPRKQASGGEPGSAGSLGRTPSSRHQRQQGGPSPRKSSLSTPLKLDAGVKMAKTPGTSHSVSKLQFQTPAFLRRIPMPKINEHSGFTSPEPIRLPRKPLLRGLSSVVADLRKMQDAELDDDLDALREAEMEDGLSKPVNRTILSDKTKLATSTEKQNDHDDVAAIILAEDAEKQALGLLGGFDEEGDDDSAGEPDAGLDRNGNPLRLFKKKGQKRTTRRSYMKPVMTKRPAGPETDPTSTAADGEEDHHRPAAPHSESDFLVSDDEDELAQDNSTTRKPATTIETNNNKRKTTAATKTTRAQTAAHAPAVKGKATRKVNELAHANFKRLKLRNHGAKGGPGHNSRFRRRR